MRETVESFVPRTNVLLVGIISVGDVSMSIATCCIIQTTMPLHFHRNENNNPTSQNKFEQLLAFLHFITIIDKKLLDDPICWGSHRNACLKSRLWNSIKMLLNKQSYYHNPFKSTTGQDWISTCKLTIERLDILFPSNSWSPSAVSWFKCLRVQHSLILIPYVCHWRCPTNNWDQRLLISCNFRDILFSPSLHFTGRQNGSMPMWTLLTRAMFEPVWEPIFCATATLELHAKGFSWE